MYVHVEREGGVHCCPHFSLYVNCPVGLPYVIVVVVVIVL
jgi:hypothetical protein